jgi:hypothetical protein
MTRTAFVAAVLGFLAGSYPIASGDFVSAAKKRHECLDHLGKICPACVVEVRGDVCVYRQP